MQSNHDINALSKPSTAWAIATWLAVQLGALGLCAMRFMFWARAPHAGEQLALCAMLATQVAASALLFPLLLRNLSSTIFAIAAAWPLAQLAAFLADAPLHQWLAAESYVSLWLIALYLWSKLLQSSWARIFAATIAAMLSLGGPLLWYLRLEFSDGGGQTPRHGWALGPIVGAISQTLSETPNAGDWGLLLLLIISTVGLVWKQSRW